MKKGFTLIELLAVIVILAIIAVIAVPIVLNIIDKTKDNAILRSVEFYLDAVEYTIADAYLYHGGLTDGEYEITSDGNICKTVLPCNEENTLKVEVNGEVPTSGTITITNGNIYDLNIVLNHKIIIKNEKDELVFQEVAEPKTFSEDSWETIAANVKLGNLSKYKVGDTKTISLGDSFGTKTVRIANISTPNECKKEEFSQTACGFVVEFTERITTHYMNAENTNIGGWEASDMRKYLNNEILNAFPIELKELIKKTKVVSGRGSDDLSNFITTDKLYLLSTNEIWGTDFGHDTAVTLTRQLDYYNGKDYEVAIKDDEFWWLRSAYKDNNQYFFFVRYTGFEDYFEAHNENGVSPAFRL